MTTSEPPLAEPVGLRDVLRVLLVENDPAAARRSEAALRAHPPLRVHTETVASLAGAIRLLLQQPFDAVVLELDVEDASGLTTLAGVRGAAPTLPVVVYARALDDTLAVRALRAGAHECHQKGELAPEQLGRLLALAMERQRRLAALEAARVDAAHRATHDPLTGLANRSLFLDQLERALAFGTRYQRKTGVLFIDLDGFKEVNDQHGHALGDRLLHVVAERLVECVRRSDAVARLGGDEFVVLLPDVTSRRDLAFVKESILASLRLPVEHEGRTLVSVGASIGCAMSPLDGSSAAELLAVADAEMYREKLQHARRSVSPPCPAADSVSHRRESRLRAALHRGEFEVFFQPIVDAVADRVIGAEALLRWRDPERGLVLPADFLALAEDTGLIVPLGEQVLRTSCLALIDWRSLPGHSALRVAVNLSAVQLREQAFERQVAAMLAETGCPPEALTLELTENSTLVDGETAVETLRALKSLGVRLVVDDFGVGHASLTFLREAPVDGLKIDRRFVMQMMENSRDHAIVASLVRLARGLGLDVVAEGVETAEQAQRLAHLHCFAQQGRHFGEAVPADVLTRLLRERSTPLRQTGGGLPLQSA